VTGIYWQLCSNLPEMADWSYGPKEDADVPSLEVFKARLERCPCPWQRSWTR